MRFLILIIFALLPSLLSAAIINAASASNADVQTAINAASDGDEVHIPNGSATWSTGITTSKQIIIKAANWTKTSGGLSSRNVVITNNSSDSLFFFVTGNSYTTGMAGIQFVEGTGGGAHVEVTGSGSKVFMMSDVTMAVKSRYFPDASPLVWEAQGGCLRNIYAIGAGGSDAGGGMIVESPYAWVNASTMGMLDSTGLINVYLEDSTLNQLSQWPDIDNNGRFVMRYCTMDGTWGLTHGFSSTFGGRHFEYYNNTYSNTVMARNLAARYFWVRAGTGIWTDNVVNNAAFPSEYGAPVLAGIGDTTDPTGYPQARQPGWGSNGSSSVIDPMYIWSNTGARAYSYGIEANWATNVQIDRELYVNNGAKPDYTKYTYPHPLWATFDGGGGGAAGAAMSGTVTLRGGASIR